MNVKLVHHDGLRTYVAVLDKNEDAVASLTQLARDYGLTGASLTAIGAFQQALVGYFDSDTRQYSPIPINGQVEVLSLVGDIALNEGEPKLHAHVVLGCPDGTTRGGHLLQGVVWPTLEVVLTETPTELRRRTDPDTGLALIALGPSE